MLSLYSYYITVAHGLSPCPEIVYSTAAPPTAITRPPAMDQSDDSMATAPDFVEAVLAGLEVAVLLFELVLEAKNVHTAHISIRLLRVRLIRAEKSIYIGLH